MANKLYDIIGRWPTLRLFVKAKRFVVPGFDGMPIFEVGRFFFNGLFKGAISMRASAVAFNFFIAIFPSVIFFFTVIPYLQIDNLNETIFETLKTILPNSTFKTVEETAMDIIDRPQGGLLSLGFVLALFFSTSGVNSLIEAFNQTYHSIESRSFLKQQLISIVLVLILSAMLIIGTSLLIGGTTFINFIVLKEWIEPGIAVIALQVFKWLMIILLFFFGISFLYYLGPSRVEKFRFISAGATLSTLLIALLSMGFNFYIDNFSKYNTLYGSIGTLIIVMLWIYFIAMVILIGFELNASIKGVKNLKV